MLENKVAIVTGGRRGLGLAMVEALQAEGMTVVVVAKSASGPGDMYVQCDLANYEQRGGLVERIADKLGRVDILVNNAGAQTPAVFADVTPGQFRRDWELMVNAPFDLCQQAAPFMRDGGHIVNILSISAFQGARNVSGYVAAKHGLLGLTKALAVELAPEIHVNAIAPGMFETDMLTGMDKARGDLLKSITPAGRFGMVDEIKAAIIYLVTSTFSYGTVLTIDGGWMVKNG